MKRDDRQLPLALAPIGDPSAPDSSPPERASAHAHVDAARDADLDAHGDEPLGDASTDPLVLDAPSRPAAISPRADRGQARASSADLQAAAKLTARAPSVDPIDSGADPTVSAPSSAAGHAGVVAQATGAADSMSERAWALGQRARAAMPAWGDLPQLPKMAADLAAVRRRTWAVGASLFAGLAMVTWRAWDVSMIHHEAYAAQGNRQQLRTFVLDAGRGEIVDRNYVSLAVNDRSHRVIVNPRVIAGSGREREVADALVEAFADQAHEFTVDASQGETDAEGASAENGEDGVRQVAATGISPAFSTTRFDACRARYGGRDVEGLGTHVCRALAWDKAYRPLRVRVTGPQAEALRERGLAGVSLERHPERVYPRGLLAAHLLGSVNREGRGHLGVELGMDDWLRGQQTTSPAYWAAHRGVGRKILVDGHPDPGTSKGHIVVLTIDSAIQAMVEEEINALVARWSPVGASIIVLDPRSGEILALANRPTFDPNHSIDDIARTFNLALQSAYEPGSTMKAITVAAALESGTIRRDQSFFCEEGRWQYTPQHAIRDTKHHQWLTVTEILATSSNICTTKIYETLGKQSLHGWVRRFRFGVRPSVQLPAANPGLLADWREWSDIQGANISFGQGMSASPLQVAAAFATLANDGLYIAPSIVSEVIDDRGERVWRHDPKGERVVRVDTARTVMEMLQSVVHTRMGTGKNAEIEGYRVAGKTSTAQKANPRGGYFEDQYYASFVGAIPADDPRVVILISVDNPEGGHYGNEVAAPTFATLGARVMSYLGVPRSDGRQLPPSKISLRRDDPRLTEGVIPEVDVEPRLPGQRPVTYTMGLPDFTGLTLTQALDAATQAGVTMIASGSGLAVAQDIPPGPVDGEVTVTVYFEAPH